jgi:hypothetical protein
VSRAGDAAAGGADELLGDVTPAAFGVFVSPLLHAAIENNITQHSKTAKTLPFFIFLPPRN